MLTSDDGLQYLAVQLLDTSPRSLVSVSLLLSAVGCWAGGVQETGCLNNELKCCKAATSSDNSPFALTLSHRFHIFMRRVYFSVSVVAPGVRIGRQFTEGFVTNL